tara:strand:+ start:2896 stop:3651 length:756 start_codon:yes stop_codon:yes gene_type:complete
MHTNIKEFYQVLEQISIQNDQQISKLTDLAKVKAENLLQLADDTQNFNSILCVGFSIVPYGLALEGYDVHVTGCDGQYTKFINRIGATDLKITEIDLPLDQISSGKYDLVLALDQYTTYCDGPDDQLKKLEELSKVTGKTLVTTLRDYKNIKSSERIIDSPFSLRHNTGTSIFVNYNDWSREDKQAWVNTAYIIHEDELFKLGPVPRRTMYFKQLAKFTTDFGATNFIVHKTNMYKPLFSKTYEYVITINY